MVVVVTVPIRLVSEANARCHWAAKARRTKATRGAVTLVLRSQVGPDGCMVASAVTFVRVAPRALDPDNLARSCKAVQDATAAWLGVDDGPRGGVAWSYSQRRGAAREYAVEIHIDGDVVESPGAAAC